MTDGKFIGMGGVGLFAVLCCAAPSLLVAAGSFGVSAWFAAAGYVLIPIALAAIGVAAFYLTGAAGPPHRPMPMAARSTTR